MLPEERRKQLDQIVSQMVSNKETDSNIQLVVNDFKQKYTQQAPAQEQKSGNLIPGSPALDIFTANTQKFGASAGQAFGANSADADALRSSNVGLTGQIEMAKAIIARKKARGEDTSRLEAALGQAQGISEATQPNQAFGVLDKTTGQVVGEGIGTALEALSGGALSGLRGAGLVTGAASKAQKAASIGKTTARVIGESLPVGYGYDVSQNLQEGKTGAEALTPGLGTVAAVALPGVIGAGQKAATFLKGSAPTVINSILKPLKNQRLFGKNPGRVIAEEGITANTFDELGTKVSNRKNQVGAQISSFDPGVPVSFTEKVGEPSIFKPIDEALTQAAKQNNEGLYNRLKKVETALKENVVRSSSLTPDEVIQSGLVTHPSVLAQGGMSPEEAIKAARKEAAALIKSDKMVSLGERNLDEMKWADSLDFKREIGDLTNWTSNRTEDNLVNESLRKVYGTVKDRMNKIATEADPKLGATIKKLNEKYADLVSAENAIRHREILMENKNTLSLTSKIGSIGGAITSVATGNVWPALIGVGAAGVEKLLGSIAVKTRVASWLAKEKPSVISKLFTEHPEIRNAIYKVVSGGASTADVKIRNSIESFNNQEKPVKGYLNSLGY